MTESPQTAIGLISGTSMDGIDAALVTTDGVRVQARGPWLTRPYPAALRRALLDIAADADRAADDPLAEIEAEVTRCNIDAARALMDEARGLTVDVVGLHGQTILHRPQRGFTRQLGDGAALARALDLPCVGDFRSADMAAGGQGAPLAPLYHAALAADLPRPVAILNLGGVGNVTVIEDGRILAFDTGPASAMIDDWVARHTGAAFDVGGAIAARGRVDATALDRLLAHPFFAAPPPKSLDRNDFPLAPVEGLGLEDGAATLTAFTVAAVAAGLPFLPAAPRRWLVTGGGRHNATMMAGLSRALGVPVDPVEAVGWQGDALEAQCFGFLAVRSLRGLPLSLPSTTGARHPVLGGVLHRPAALRPAAG